MNLSLRPYQPSDADAWDAFCATAYQATFLHTRRFLSYHGNRFQDLSLILEDGGRWVGLFPAALHPEDARCVVSHPGITYGGLLHAGALRGERAVEALAAIRDYFAAHGHSRLVYKAVPTFYHTTPAQDDLYALFRLGAARVRCDLSCAIDLARRLSPSERRRRGQMKALRSGVEIREGSGFLPALWEVVMDNLRRKHRVSPVHTLAEIALLAERFPANIRCVVALCAEEVVAGTVIFSTMVADHAQYIASSERGYEVAALDAVFEHCIASAANNGKRWFDFGISTENSGLVLNEGLYRFKSEFGGGGFIHEFFELAW
ncbi:MAG TPA: GNAT family N-acetyltransferase [Burkholderiales bacterium]|nr:GNAT family N-acetyltransferase [Burkholderiales bacterium]